jgi:hypothetical protein
VHAEHVLEAVNRLADTIVGIQGGEHRNEDRGLQGIQLASRIEAHNWFVDMEKLLKITACTKVLYTAYKFCPLPYPKIKSYRINKITLKEVCIKEAAASSEKTDFGKIRAQNYLDHMNKPIMEDRYYIYPCAFSKRHQAIADNACEKQRNQTSMELL